MVKSPRLTWPMIPDDLDVEPHSDQPSRQRPAAAVNIWNAPSQQKKPRHRHSPAAIAALNELYDRDEHPALELRTSLAKRLGMEVKTVNAWFQNKRASSKKQRSRGGVPSQRTSRGKGANTPQDLHKYDDDLEDEDDYSRADSPYSLNNSSVSIAGSDNPSQTVSPTFYAGNPDHTHFLVEPTDMPRKMRNRPTAEQTEELRKLYNQNPHPSTEQRQMLAERINMRYQSITNWFQNQRSLAKKRREDDGDVSTDSPSNSREWPEPNRTFAAFPPPSSHPSLHLPPPSTHPSLGLPSVSAPPSRRSVSVTPSIIGDEPSPSKRSRRSGTPYSSTAPSSRPRRTRPEPYQLHALKELSAKTINPSIEARTALALEIGMDLGKVTNWFRNLRQTARKRASKKMGSGDDDYEDNDTEGYIALSLPSASVSRANSPFVTSSSSSSHDVDDPMDVDHHHRSEPRRRRVIRALSEFDMETPSQQASDDGASDEDFEEAVTPSPDPSPSPPSPTDIPMPMPISMPMQLPSPPNHGHTHAHVDLRMVLDQTYPSEMDNKSAHSSNVTIEDALLLLSFHQRAVH
ncbi:hypothetical protein CCMSSC00406_0002723 [Pleurotus cornucopiae]|uniref:Uncharacterized protein n=1 Tax=Pleurotus cornucopiae TaxID=5321 RepID=A0ACB7IYL8_PLECO|nr:hypothetical protein CCMSSC00406_0002723 [Pleurotus cornucopiae]